MNEKDRAVIVERFAMEFLRPELRGTGINLRLESPDEHGNSWRIRLSFEYQSVLELPSGEVEDMGAWLALRADELSSLADGMREAIAKSAARKWDDVFGPHSPKDRS